MRGWRAGALAAALALPGCDVLDPRTSKLATDCLRASDDNRVRLSGSLAVEAQVEVTDDLVVVRTRVPAGIGLDARLRFRHWVYRCRRDGESLHFLDYTVGE